MGLKALMTELGFTLIQKSMAVQNHVRGPAPDRIQNLLTILKPKIDDHALDPRAHMLDQSFEILEEDGVVGFQGILIGSTEVDDHLEEVVISHESEID